ncbi:unnamed protein product [Amoebophrya sp. A120]|nr:unnamed protein product [Amoebophrya sp. A120]|eukprot:GSA120T00006955001.1
MASTEPPAPPAAAMSQQQQSLPAPQQQPLQPDYNNSKTSNFSLYLDQIKTLLIKDFLLSSRSCCTITGALICPAFMLFFSTFFILFIDERIFEQPYQTVNVKTRQIQQNYAFDPFPAQCGELGSSEYVESFASWRDEQQVPLPENYDTKFDCFIDAMSDIVPFWREMILQSRQQPAWAPRVQTFGVSPGVQDDAMTLGGRFANYLYKRYDDKMYLTIALYNLMQDSCFNTIFANLTANFGLPSAFPTGITAVVGAVAPTTASSFCLENDPVACLNLCQDGASLPGRTVLPNTANVTIGPDYVSNGVTMKNKTQVSYWTHANSALDFTDANYVAPVPPASVAESFAAQLNAIVVQNAVRVAAMNSGRRLAQGEEESVGDFSAGRMMFDDSSAMSSSSISSNSGGREQTSSSGLDIAVDHEDLEDHTDEGAFGPSGTLQMSPKSSGSTASSLFATAARRAAKDNKRRQKPSFQTGLQLLDHVRDVYQKRWLQHEEMRTTSVQQKTSQNNLVYHHGAQEDRDIRSTTPGINKAVTTTSPSPSSSFRPDLSRSERVHRQLRQANPFSPATFEKLFFAERFLKNNKPVRKSSNQLRRLAINCDSANSACDCAKLRPDCGWFSQSTDRDGEGSCREAVNSRGGAKGEVAVETSCFECDTQTTSDGTVFPCSRTSLWLRMGTALPLLKPYVRVFRDEDAMKDLINHSEYPQVITVLDASSGTQVSKQVSEMLCAAVSFIDGEDGDGTAPINLAQARLQSQLQFDIRTNESDINGRDFGYTPQYKVAPRASEFYLGTYARSGFLGLQNVVNDFLSCASDSLNCFLGTNHFTIPVTTPSKKPDVDNIALINFGLPKFWNNARLVAVLGENDDMADSVFFGLCIPILPLIGRILREKELKIREGMKIMGLYDLSYYFAVSIFHTIFGFFVACILMLVWAVLPDWQKYSGGGWLFWFFWVSSVHCTQFALFLTTFFSNATFGKIACTGIVSLSGLFSVLLPTLDVSWTSAGRIAFRRFIVMWCPGTTVTYALRVWYELEMRTDGVTIDTVGLRITSKTTDFSFLDCILMSIVGIIWYTCLFVYADQVTPSEYGIPRVWYFPFTKTFWKEDVFGIFDAKSDADRGTSELQAGAVDKGALNPSDLAQEPQLTRQQSKGEESNFSKDDTTLSKFFEKPTYQQQQLHQQNDCVKIRNLRKEFHTNTTADGKPFVAVNDINLTMYRDEIFVLLGHNGAGKTTTFSMLYGLIPMTKGDCSFFGLSSKQQLSANRGKVGICPQHSVLWENLTVLEHLLLFAYFKGVSRSDALIQADELLREQMMEDKKNALAKTLSGGMQRKLSLAIAFMGNPNLVFLDEPSSGMDTSARREIWDLLRTRKSGRVIVLTTHYMDEADVLADRVAIMSHGNVKCVGTTQFLKQAYGCGYNLSFNCTQPAIEIVEKFSNFLDEEVFQSKNDCKLMTTAGNEMLFLVPFEVSHKFPKAFELLEQRKQDFGIISYQLLVCNLEEVFLKVASDQADSEEKLAQTILERTQTGSKENLGAIMDSDTTVGVPVPGTGRKSSSWGYVELQPSSTRMLYGLLQKRFINGKRYWGTTICQLTCPVVYLLIIIIITKIALSDWPRLKLTADSHYNMEIESESERRSVAAATGAVSAKDFNPAASFTALETSGLGAELRLHNAPFIANDTLYASSCPWDACEQFTYKTGDAQWGAMSPYGGCKAVDKTAKQGELVAALSKNYDDSHVYSSTTTQQAQASSSTPLAGPLASLTQPQPAWYGFFQQMIHLDYWLEHNTKQTKKEESKYGAFLISEKNNVVIKVNGTGIHAPAIFLQQYHNAAARDAGKHGRRIPYLHPLPTTAAERTAELNDAAFVLGMGIVLSFGFVSCFALVFIVEEKEKEVKVQQFVNGVGITRYWLSNLIYDFSLYLFPIFTILLLFEAFDLTLFTNSRAIGASICLLIFFAAAMPLFSYIVATQFKSADSAMSVSIVLNVIFGFVLFLVGLLLELIRFDTTRSLLKTFDPLLRLWPMYSLGEGVRRIFFTSYYWQGTPPESVPDAFWAKCEKEYDEHNVAPFECCQDIFDRFGAGPAITYLGIEIILYFSIVVLLDYLTQEVRYRQYMEPVAPFDKNDPVNLRQYRDQGVLNEETTALSNISDEAVKEQYGVLCQNVNKVFQIADIVGAEGERTDSDKNCCESCLTSCCLCCPSLVKALFDRCKNKTTINAVRDVSFALKKGEVLGLLGANGAGKTTTFRMLCGITVPARHEQTEIKIGGHSMYTERDECRKIIGYTSQANPIWDSMTVIEHLEFYALVKGVPAEYFQETIDKTIQDMDLVIHKHKKAGTLSGGNKRKLVIAMSLIGAPPVLFLDEPSAGMDPEARRNMWSIIQRIATKQKHSTVILTTHSMDECEALCTKVTIMTQGVMRCFGSIPEIKAQYGNGFDLYVKLESPSFTEQKQLWTTFLGSNAMLNPDDVNAMNSNIMLIHLCQLLHQYDPVWPLQQRIQFLLRASRASPYASVARLSSKPQDKIRNDELLEMQASTCKAKVILHWLTQSVYRLTLTDYVAQTFPGAFLTDSQGGSEQVTFRIFADQKKLGQLFGLLESVKVQFKIKEYAISPTSLEQIFNTFTKSHMEQGAPQMQQQQQTQLTTAQMVPMGNSAAAASSSSAVPGAGVDETARTSGKADLVGPPVTVVVTSPPIDNSAGGDSGMGINMGSGQPGAHQVAPDNK